MRGRKEHKLHSHRKSTVWGLYVFAFTGVLIAMAAVLLLPPVSVAAEEAAPVEINEENFPDEIFRQYVSDNFDTDGNGFLSELEIARQDSINVFNENITTLKGIEFFTSLKKLNCGNNQLTDLDVSKNVALTSLHCNLNQLTQLDVSQNTALLHLCCDHNAITELNLEKNENLSILECQYTKLTSLDVSNNTNLTILNCNSSLLEEISLGTHEKLFRIECMGLEKLSELDLSGCPALKELSLSGCGFASLDVSQNTKLEMLGCGSNQLTSLDVSQNTALKTLDCQDNRLTSLDVSQNTGLTRLVCGQNPLGSLDVSRNTALNFLDCFASRLTSLDVSQNTELTTLRCGRNQLTSLDLSNNTKLALNSDYSFSCSDNIYELQTCEDFDLAELSQYGFELSKASNWRASKLTDDGKLIYLSYGPQPRYDYDCGQGKSVEFVIQFPDHSLNVIAEKKPTCTEAGNVAYYHCSVCGHNFTALSCEELIESVEIAANGHVYETDWKSDSENHWHKCENCDVITGNAAHTWDEGVVTTKPTEASKGEKTYTCTVCKATKAEEVDYVPPTPTPGMPETTPTPELTPTPTPGIPETTPTPELTPTPTNTPAPTPTNTPVPTPTNTPVPTPTNTPVPTPTNTPVPTPTNTPVPIPTTRPEPPHRHDYIDGVCDCGATDPDYVPPHSHTYINGVCDCGETDPNHVHIYENGICTICGAKNPGYIEVIVSSGENAPAISSDAKGLEETVLTPEEKQQAEGVDIKVYLTVEDAGESISDADKAAVEEALEEDYRIGQYLDISLFKVIGENRTQILETKQSIRITIDVPVGLKPADGAAERTFSIIRVHNGEAVVLEDMDSDTDTITIETDRFSSYTIVYQEDEEAEEVKDDEPKTGDTAGTEWYAIFIFMIGFSGLLLYAKEHRHNKTGREKR